MSKNWRIKKRVTPIITTYILQKRLFGFLWWHDPHTFDPYNYGVYRLEDDAREAYKRKITPDKIKYLDI
tara:strand:- start:625 stop:831 length:207 start_codon:yes stop_codon:yes gene_type:complete